MNGNKKNRKLSAELLIILIPMIAAFIIIVAVIILTRSRSVIIEEANRQLFNESEANASDIGRTIASIKNFYDGVVVAKIAQNKTLVHGKILGGG